MENEQNLSTNIVVPNKDLAILKQHFSHCFNKTGDFDFDKFKQELSNKEINFSKESYGMNWLGKSYARLLAVDPAKTLIKEDHEWNNKPANKNSENVLIKGDNLEVLKHLSNAYHEKVKMIYIDPPYNTGTDDFVYEDDRKFTVEKFSELAGVDKDEAEKILQFVGSKSNSHSAWLTFMYPRLYIARQLLQDDGLIFVSIDNHEVAQLRILMDEIFGEENCLSIITWRRTKNKSNQSKHFSNVIDHILCYSKNFGNVLIEKIASDNTGYKYHDDKGVYSRNTLLDKKRGAHDFPIISPKGRTLHGPWVITKDKFLQLIEEDKVHWSNGKKETPYKKKYFTETKGLSTPDNFWDSKLFGSNQDASVEFEKLFSMGKIFDYPKPTKLIKKILEIGCISRNEIVLDFFAGSGTTGDAVMQLNAEDKANGREGNRKYILVQLPEVILEDTNATAYDFVTNELGVASPTIFDITKERLIKAAKDIHDKNVDQPAKTEKVKCEGIQNEEHDAEHCLGCIGTHSVKYEAKKATDLSKVDFSFKIFETQPIWEDYELEAKEYDSILPIFDDSKLTAEDRQTLLTTWKTYDNIALTDSLNFINLNGYVGHYGHGKLYLMNKGFKTKNLTELLNQIDANKAFSPTCIIAFGYAFESKMLREIAENVSSYANKKNLDIDFITRY